MRHPRTRNALVAASLLIAACNDAPPAPPAPPTPTVTVVTLQAETVMLERELPGRARPYMVAEVRPQVSGIIARRLFEEGGHVEAGQPLYRLDDAAYRAELDNARARLARAEATRESARLLARRAAGLVQVEAVSQQEHEDATAALAQAEADVAAARAALQSASVTLGYAHIDAPIGGRIGRSSVTQGALVTANQAGALATIQQLDPMYVDLTQSSKELLELRRAFTSGRLERVDSVPVTIMLEDGSTLEHKGRLEFSEVTVDPGTGSYVLRVAVDNPDEVLLPGMYVRAVLGTAARHDAILVPQGAVSRDPKGQASVLLVDAEGIVEARPIELSQIIGHRWLVETGLAAGERVIVEGLQKVMPGAPAQAEERDTGTAD